MLSPDYFFDLADQDAAGLFDGVTVVWEVLPRIKAFISQGLVSSVAGVREKSEVLDRTHVLWRSEIFTEDIRLKRGDAAKGTFEVFHRGERLEGASVIYAGVTLMDDDIQIGQGVIIEPGALIKGPTRIGDFSEIRQGAYLRGSCLVGRRCVVGHVTEMKNSVLLDDAKAGHFAYMGDSILGRDVNLGAGTKLANLKIIDRPYRIKLGEVTHIIERRKFGAILGDGCETGCNSVTNPGTVMGPRCLVAPCISVKPGYHPARSVVR